MKNNFISRSTRFTSGKKIYIILLYFLLCGIAKAQTYIPTNPNSFVTQWTALSDSLVYQGASTGYTARLYNSSGTLISTQTQSGATPTTLTFNGLTSGQTYYMEADNLTKFQNNSIDLNQAQIYYDSLVSVLQWGTSVWTDTSKMFANTKVIVQATDVPNFSNVHNMSYMFGMINPGLFNTNLTTIPRANEWDTSQVEDMSNMFLNAHAFNQDIGRWNTSGVDNMAGMFNAAYAFNQNIGNWDTSKVKDMSSMFFNASAFNNGNSGDIGNWDTSGVNKMFQMFRSASVFNQNISKWDTSQVTDMGLMFWNANTFDQNISKWDISKVQYASTTSHDGFTNIFNSSDLSCANLSQILINWAPKMLTTTTSTPTYIFGIAGLTYDTASTVAARAIMTSKGYALGGTAGKCPWVIPVNPQLRIRIK